MSTASRIWFALGAFVAAAGVVYGLTSHEVAGAPLLLVCGAVFGFLGLIGRSQGRREGENTGEEPHVAPTIWPFGFSIAAVLIAVGFIVSKWVLVAGVLVFAVCAAGWLREVTRSHEHH